MACASALFPRTHAYCALTVMPSIAGRSALGVRCRGHGTAYDFPQHRSRHEGVGISGAPPLVKIRAGHQCEHVWYRFVKSCQHYSGGSNGGRSPLGTPFSPIFRRATKDGVPEGTSSIEKKQLGKNVGQKAMVPEGTSSIERNQVSKYVKPKKLVPEGPKRKKAAGKT